MRRNAVQNQIHIVKATHLLQCILSAIKNLINSGKPRGERTYTVNRNVNKDIYYFKQCRGSSKIEIERLCNPYISKYGKTENSLTWRHLDTCQFYSYWQRREINLSIYQQMTGWRKCGVIFLFNLLYWWIKYFWNITSDLYSK